MKYSYNNLGSYLYSRLPHYHKVLDEQNELLLKRFFEVLNVGFKANDEALKLALEKTQASKCGEDYLEELAKSMGADWISTIDPKYQRTVIRMLIKLYKQKGTIDTIRFIASELSGFEAKVIEGEIPSEYYEEGDEKKRLLTIKLEAPEFDDPVQAQQHETTISEVIGKFVPVHTKYILVVIYFYDEPYYKRMTSQITQDIKQDLGTHFKPHSDFDIEDIINLYVQDYFKHTFNVEQRIEDNIVQKFQHECPIIETVTEFNSDIPKITNSEVVNLDVENEGDNVTIVMKTNTEVHKYNQTGKVLRLNDTLCRLNSTTYRLSKMTYVDVIKTSEGEVKIYE